jgi:ABC-type nitrate/sulfonate/bicarbonate transport system ATPase subunit
MIFQEPMTALNPLLPVGRQIAEMFVLHTGASWGEANERAIESLRQVRVPSPERRVKDHPHQLSGGMRQRVELARAMAGDSDVLLMDEPFSALDYQTRHRMRRELVRLLRQVPRTVVFVTHDIEEAAVLADRVAVLSDRPATISCELRVDLPRPREVTDPEVVEAVRRIMSELHLQDEAEAVPAGVKL